MLLNQIIPTDSQAELSSTELVENIKAKWRQFYKEVVRNLSLTNDEMNAHPLKLAFDQSVEKLKTQYPSYAEEVLPELLKELSES